MNRFFVVVITLFLGWGIIGSCTALTTLINPTGDGGLETGTTFAANGWTIDGSSTLNRYWVGNAPTVYAGSRCSFIDADGAAPWNNTNGTVVKHMYRDVTFPSGEGTITLSFYYKVLNADATNDYFAVYLAATSYTPVSGTVPTGTQIGSTYGTSTTWALVTITVPASYAGTSSRLIFTWVNNNSAPRGLGALDNISLTSDVVDPASLTATAASTSQISLAWTKNTSSQDVLVAYNTTNSFGTPVNGTTYVAGNTIGSATVIYKGSLTSFNHTSLSAGTPYYYKAWSLSGTPNYSPGITANATTLTTTATVSVGTVAATVATTPITGAVAYSYTQQLFTPAQIGLKGTIKKLRFYYSSGGTANSSSWTVYMGHTTKTTFSSTTDWVAVGSMTQVFSGTVTFPAAGNWLEITLSTQFAYNNTDNLVIAVDENTAGNAGSACNWGSFTSTANTAIIYSNATTNPNPASPPTATSRSSSINGIQLDIESIDPRSFTATSWYSAQINLSWVKNVGNEDVMVAWNSTNTFGTPTNGVTYNVGSSVSGGGTVIYNGGETSYSHLPLIAGTQYYYKIWTRNPSVVYSTGVTANATTTAIANPATFTATPLSSSQIELNWTRNAAGNRVMVAWNTSNTFGTPTGGTSYSVGNSISGGGTVIYSGNGVNYVHAGLNASTPYYYKVWSIDARPNYSTGITANATTSSYSNTTTVSVGTGTATVATVPITAAVAYSYTQQIYTQAQILNAGTISKLRFYYSSGGTANSTTWTVYLGHTTKTTFASTTDWVPDTEMVQVFRGLVTFPAAGNWMEITLQKQFPYNNISNLVIAVDENNVGVAGSACNWGSFTSGSNTAMIYSNASTNPYPAYPPTATSRSSSINRIQFDLNSYTVEPPAVSRLLVTNSNKSQSLKVTNNGNTSMVISNVTDSAAWLTYTASTPITVLPGNSYLLPLTLDATGLGAGTNTTNLVITANAGTITVPISLRVITGSVPVNPRHVAQYENADAALIRYPLGIPYSMVVDLADDDPLYCVVSSANQATAITNFTSNGVNMSNVNWIVAASDSYWSRDWGPMTIFEGGPSNREMRLIDFHYNRNARTNDNALPSVIATQLSIPYYFIPASLTGGNNMTDGMGLEFSDWYAYEQNDGDAATGTESGFTEIYSYTQTEFDDLYRLYMGSDANGFNLFDDPTATYIHHMDTYSKLLDVDKVIVAQVASSDTRYSAYEALAAHWASLTSAYGTPFTIYRVTETGNEAYTNSFHFNDEIFVPFEGSTNDAAALAVYQAALPGHTVRGYLAGTNAWVNTDAIHCRVNTIFSPTEEEQLPVELSSFTATISATNYVTLNWVTQSETNVAGFRVYRGLSDDISEAEALNVFIPGTNTSQMQSYIYQDNDIYEDGTYFYWLENQDMDGTSGLHGPISIQVQLSFNPGIPPIPIEKGINNIYPNPFNPTTTILYGLPSRGKVSIDIYNLRGQLVRNLMEATKDPGYSRITWDGKNNSGNQCSSGIYFIVMRSGNEYFTRKAMLAK